MLHDYIADLQALDSPKKQVTIKGWVKTIRESKGMAFVEVNDGSCRQNMQLVIEEKDACFETARKLTPGSSLQVVGEMVPSPAPKQKYEIKAKEIHIYGLCDPETFPIQKKKTSDEFLRTVAHLRPRTNKYAAMLRIRSELAFAIHKFFNEKGFYYIHTPIITGSDAEGAGQMFQVTTFDLKNPPKTPEGALDFSKDFFGKKTSLTVSGQLEGELAATALGRIYTFGPTFRAENSNTPRHCAEFWMVEPEMAFYELEDNMDLGEDFVKSIVKHVMNKCEADLSLFNQFVDTTLFDTLKNVTENTFERLSYTDAVKILEENNKKFEVKVAWGDDLMTEHERFITEQYFKKPVIVFNYPKAIKSFYMKQNDDGMTVRGMDLLVPRIGELIGGSQREDDLAKIESRLDELNMTIKDYWWYLDIRRFGSVPHSGFGLGFERAVMLVTGISNIRDVTAFPRVPNYAEF